MASPEPQARAGNSDKVWTTLITNLTYLPGLLTLDHSLKRAGSAYPLVALYTDTFPPAGHAALDSRQIPKKRIPYLLPTTGKDYSADPRFYDCWSKLTPFNLTEYTRVVQLDSDMLVLKNMDELMEIDLDPPSIAERGGGDSKRVFAAGHACVCNPLHKPHYPSDWIPEHCAFTSQHSVPDLAQHTGPDPASGPLGFMNGGLIVVNPSATIFQHILGYMETNAHAMDFADQSLLSGLFRGRWVSLPYVYNALKTLRWEGVHEEIWRDESVKNVHYILAPKPWDEVVDGKWSGEEERNRVSHSWWVDVDRERKEKERERGIDDGF